MVPAIAALALTASAPRAQAQLAVPGDASPGTWTSLGYRDGTLWIAAERAPHRPGELQRVRLHAGELRFEAQIDAQAIVQLAAGADPSALFARERLQLTRRLSERARLYQVRGRSGEDGLDVAQRLAAVSGIEEAMPDLHLARQKHDFSIPPNDPHYPGQWYLSKLKIDSAWRLSGGDPATTIVVVDDGCDTQHPDLIANMLPGRDLVDMDDDPSYAPGLRGNAHGTQCSGLIAAQADNGEGIAGVCPQCTLRCVRLLRDDDQATPISADIQAFDYALEIGASVVSNSWGFSDAVAVPAALRSILERVSREGRDGRGALVVFAAGNDNRVINSNEITAVRGVLSVGAVTNFDEATSFSNRGPSVDLAAPTGTFTTDISGSDGDGDGDYTSLFGGTSSACPIVAGAAGLLLSARPELSADEASDLLIASARPAPYARPDDQRHDPVYGYGILDPVAALEMALGVQDPEASDAGSDAAVAPEDHKRDSSCSIARVGTHGTGIVPCFALLWAHAILRLRRRRT